MSAHAPTVRTEHAPRPAAVVFLLLVVAGIGVATLGPRGLVLMARIEAVDAINAVLGRFDASLTTMQIEDLANIALFVPLGLAVAAVLPRRAWWFALPICVAATAAIELSQSVIPGRVPDLSDVVLNAVGAAIGCAILGIRRAVRRN
ncbi:VanZ family protein [Leucobacter sp. OAMLP11]|uniref:VanZ family protein n=1 Tax=unclassified Leucobacter TaxID=2621730 RepID=UPI000C17CCCC|nr:MULTISPECIES: VanZ family protein [unclassified Leucobacter]PIO52004.1 VanZ family protein [Leucobacter sp. OAMLP11]